jgi:hypothetical protein
VNHVGPILFTLLVAAGEADTPATHAIVQALRDALAGDVVTTVLETEGVPSDDELLAQEPETSRGVIALVRWSGETRLEAQVKVHLRASGRWIERRLAFAPTDDPRERGRTLGFTLASMLPERGPGPPKPRALVTEPMPTQQPGQFALDALVLGSLGVNGNAAGVGGGVAVRRAPLPSLALRGELAGRTGVVQPAQATALSLRLAVGVAWSPFFPLQARRANLAVRADLALFYESLGHLSADDVERVRQGRFLPGADLALEGSFPVLGQAALVVGLGAELTFGHTDVYVHRQKVAVIPPLRLVTFVGLRHHF